MSTRRATSGTGALTFSPHGRPDKGGGDRRPARRQRGQHESDNEPRRCMALRAPSADKRALTLKTTRRHGPNTESALSSQVYKSQHRVPHGEVRALGAGLSRSVRHGRGGGAVARRREALRELPEPGTHDLVPVDLDGDGGLPEVVLDPGDVALVFVRQS